MIENDERYYGNKLRVLKILEILKKETDEDHSISTNEIANKLLDMGITSNRKTLYDDLEVLSKEFDILKDYNGKNNYKLLDRDFDPTEIQIILSALMTAGFLPLDRTKELINKFKNTLSIYQAEDISNNIRLNDIKKHTNNTVLYSLSNIMQAITKKRLIKFKYFHYNLDKSKRINDKIGIPLDLIYNENYYYVIAYDLDKEVNRTYRLDRMLDVTILGKAFSVEYDSSQILKSFNMFQGEIKRIDLKIHKDIMDPIIDKFGEEIIAQVIDDNHVGITVETQISKTFYAWLVSLDDKIEIIGPSNIREEFKNYLNKISSKY